MPSISHLALLEVKQELLKQGYSSDLPDSDENDEVQSLIVYLNETGEKPENKLVNLVTKICKKHKCQAFASETEKETDQDTQEELSYIVFDIEPLSTTISIDS